MTDYYDRALRMQKEGAQMDFGTAKSTKVTYQSQFEEQKAAMMYMELGIWLAYLRTKKQIRQK